MCDNSPILISSDSEEPKVQKLLRNIQETTHVFPDLVSAPKHHLKGNTRHLLGEMLNLEHPEQIILKNSNNFADYYQKYKKQDEKFVN